jgi:integrase/recombinase XerD
MAEHGGAADAPLFRPVKNNRTGTLDKHLDPGSIYRNIVRKYGRETGINAEVNGLCVHSMRATAATNALSHEADIAKVQSGSGMRTFPRRGFMIGAAASRKIVRPSR